MDDTATRLLLAKILIQKERELNEPIIGTMFDYWFITISYWIVQMVVDIYNTDNRYDLIVADPPWKQSKGGKKSVRKNSSGKPLDYPVCSLDEIKEHLRQATSLARGRT